MNIHVIGNGFNLPHGVPTKYGDFLRFYEMVRRIYNVSRFEKSFGSVIIN